MRRAARIIARLTAASAGSGRGQARARPSMPLVADERDVDVEVGERPQRPVVDGGQRPAADPAAEHQHVEVGAGAEQVVAMAGELTTTVSSRSAGSSLGQPGGGGAGVEDDRALLGQLGEREPWRCAPSPSVSTASRAASAGSKPSRSTGIAPPCTRRSTPARSSDGQVAADGLGGDVELVGQRQPPRPGPRPGPCEGSPAAAPRRT